jgi:uncharacterized protein
MTNQPRTTTATPFARPLFVMAKPAGAFCNLRCDYCYYLEKAVTLSPGHKCGNVQEGTTALNAKNTMSDALLELFTKQYIDAQTQREVLFTWHGGEPLTMPISFYEKAMALQRKHANGHLIDNCIQTNGTLIDENWCRMFKENNWLVGVSIDGTREMHDRYRRNANGQGSFDKVMRGIELLNRYGVMWNAMAVVNSHNAEYPVEFYNFFKSIGCRYIQFTPIVERTIDGHLATIDDRQEDCKLTEMSVSPEQWGRFACGVFDEWVQGDIGEYFIQLFEATLANWVGSEPGVCSLAKDCGFALAMEPGGDVYACDHFVFPQYRLGNINEQPLAGMAYSPRQSAFRRLKPSLPRQCMECQWRFACNGECPKNRFATTKGGEQGLNYLCEGYKMFFSHVAPYMEILKREFGHG